MSAHEEQSNAASESYTAEQIDETDREFSLDLIEEKIKANLESLHAQVSMLTLLMNKLFQDNPAGTNLTTGPRECRLPTKSPFTDNTGRPESCQ